MVEVEHPEAFLPLTASSQGHIDSTEVPIIKVVSLYHSSLTEGFSESLRRKNSRHAMEPSAYPPGASAKRRRLVKEANPAPSQKGGTSFNSKRRSASDQVSKGKRNLSLKALAVIFLLP